MQPCSRLPQEVSAAAERSTGRSQAPSSPPAPAVLPEKLLLQGCSDAGREYCVWESLKVLSLVTQQSGWERVGSRESAMEVKAARAENIARKK